MLSSGTKLGVYEILEPLGAGGMGEVYRARDTKLNRDIALKVLPPHVADDPDRMARFRREAQVLASLNHPHIAQIHGFEEPSTRSGQASPCALIMELVEGPTLAERIAHGPLPVAEVVAIAGQIADALEAAHDKGIVHRDLKPANVKVKDDGNVKVLDFGLAKAMDPAADAADPSASPTLTARATQLGVILGTAAYMAPEQAKGRAVDKRADIWAFGVVLYEMLTGRRAFQGDDASDVLAAVLRQDMDWSALPKDTPPALRRLLQRCLDRDPKKRLRDIGDALFELNAPVEFAPPAVTPQTPRRSVASALLPWAAAVSIAGGAIAWALLHKPAEPARVVTRGQTVLKDASLLVSLSRDGTRLAYNAIPGGAVPVIALRMMDQFDAKIVPGSNGGVAPLFSPDGQWIAFSTIDAPRKIRKIPVTGGTTVPICDGDLFLGGTGATTTVSSSVDRRA